MERTAGVFGPCASPLESIPSTWETFSHRTRAHLFDAASNVSRRQLLRHMDIQHVSVKFNIRDVTIRVVVLPSLEETVRSTLLRVDRSACNERVPTIGMRACRIYRSYLPTSSLQFVVSRSKSLRTPSNMFIVSLAIFDIIMAFEMPMLVINSFIERMIGWEIGCDVYSVFGSISGMGQAITNAAIAFDRYRFTIIPFRHRLLFTNRDIESSLSCRTISCPIDGRLNSKQAAIIIAFTWFWVTPFTVLPLLKVWGRYTTGNKFHFSFLENARPVPLPYASL